MRLSKFIPAAALFLAALTTIPVAGQVMKAKKPRLQTLDPNIVNYIRPGVQVKIVSAAIAQDGTITTRVNLTDPKGVPLDKDGIQSPGTISMRFIAAYIPQGQSKYVAYTTTVLKATLNNNPAQTQAAAESNGTFTTNAVGDYTYKFATKAPAKFDPTVTHTIGVTAQRDLSEFMTYDEWAETANDTLNFMPDGSAVKAIRSVVSTQACNQCHDPLFGHGGSRLTVEICILCHSPQTINPDTLLSQDMPILIHKIHMGKNLPSVKAGTPYRIWHRGAWSDFSNVGFPTGVDELKTCTVCHQNAPQANNYLTKPSRDACGACHDDVNFATGQNHVNLPQANDNQCAQCHVADSGSEFDASIKGAHIVGTRSTQLPGVNFKLVSIANGKPGQKPTVTFAVNDKGGNRVDISKMTNLSLVLTGPTTDYNGYTSEDVRKATLSGDQYTYTFNAALPATAKGTYAVGMEGYNNVTINPGTVNAATVRDIGFNQVMYFAVDNSKVTPRRQIVSQKACTTCHNTLMLHGGFRQNVEYCVVCHNPQVTDVAQRNTGDTPESINFKTMIHKIHTGEELTTDFTVMGHNKSVNNYNDIGYPGDRKDCAQCHVNNSNLLPLPDTAASQVAPRDYINPMPPTSGACLSCHTTKSAAAHASLMTSPTLGESCASCHGPNTDAAVDKVHGR